MKDRKQRFDRSASIVYPWEFTIDYRRPRITSLRKELRENLFEGIFVDQARRTLLLEAPIDQLDLFPGESGGSRESGEFLRLVSAAEGERGAPGTP